MAQWQRVHLLVQETQVHNKKQLMAESEEQLKSLLMKVKEESEKVGLKLDIQPRAQTRRPSGQVHITLTVYR